MTLFRFHLMTLALALSLLYACIDDTSGYEAMHNNGDNFQARGIAVIGSDYLSSSVSIIDRDSQTLFSEGIINSGSADPGLSIALSGDVVFPLTPDPYGNIVLIDRFPNSVINFLDPEDFSLEKQLSVATGFASNPHDYLRISADKAYITRYEKNASPGQEDFDGGDDILVINPQSYEITGRIELSAAIGNHDTENLHVRPDRMIHAAGKIWVSCDYLSGDFNSAGDGLIMIIDPEKDRVEASLEIPEMTNCTGLTHGGEDDSVFVSCTGLFSSGSKTQIERSGIVAIDLSDDEPSYRIVAHGEVKENRPYGFELAYVSNGKLLAVKFGNISSGLNDQLVLLELNTNTQTVVHTASTPFGLGGFLFDADNNLLYVGDADPKKPLIHLHAYVGGVFSKTGEIVSHPKSGLPPRHIAFF